MRLTEEGLVFGSASSAHATVIPFPAPSAPVVFPLLIPERALEEGEQYRFHFNMTKCIGCRSCEVACNEQNGNPADILWRRIGELEAGSYPKTQRHYLSMGCNHCLDAECVKGCPVDAYTKDPVTGIVLHSADACIGCQYCVWNCPYSVPQFNPERGVVGKCDMCKGRLEDGFEPACVNACPEAAIEIEIVNVGRWRENFSEAESPGMPSAVHTISTTRITLPENTTSALERVDAGQIHPEHAHLSLVFMTTLMQAVTGAFCLLMLHHELDVIRLCILLAIAGVALTISTMHLGRPAYAWRALKMWRRSWLSREVLLFTLFLFTLIAVTACVGAGQLHHGFAAGTILKLEWAAALLGIAGNLASAYIYLVPARPSWNMLHTPIDFVLSGAFLGSLLAAVLGEIPRSLTAGTPFAEQASPFVAGWLPTSLAGVFGLAWLLNQGVRLYRLRSSRLFEARASFSLLSSELLQRRTTASFVLVPLSVVAMASGQTVLSIAVGLAGVLLARYLFFVSVVPLNMALTFVRGRSA
ncbi:MAG TPA: DmsC/YnfH family molybdoenzyme membrane anchor subunit [Acidobacteriaceae bacterium]